MEDKRFLVATPPEKYEEAALLAKANGMSLNALVRSLMIRATMLPEQFGLVPVAEGDRQHRPIRRPAKRQTAKQAQPD